MEKTRTANPPATSDTPGRPKDSGSRQQTHHDQGAETGSGKLDKDLTQRGGTTLPRDRVVPEK
ncbi:MAG: hypothetical protein JOY91_07400 [Sinobacteraceae bacterium]|nr:hypothetical protein [Nevskiaceae bacterium]